MKPDFVMLMLDGTWRGAARLNPVLCGPGTVLWGSRLTPGFPARRFPFLNGRIVETRLAFQAAMTSLALAP